ncbi:hypothetical protein FRC08_004885 [Ceratobasidium sp. 394]|nr:hypothetical protein FRC08_004885 [Ceratobasidium sp. 394]
MATWLFSAHTRSTSSFPTSETAALSYSRPPDATVLLQLGLFSRQLYFDDYSQYRALCAFLGVFIGTEANREAAGIQVQSDGFVAAPSREKLANHLPEYLDCGFSSSPVSALKDLVGYRREGTEFLRTHLGKLLHARQLTPNDF